MHILRKVFFYISFTVPWALQLIAYSKLNHFPPPPPLLFFPPHLPTPLNPGQPQLPDQMWKRKKGSRRRDEGQGEATSCGERRLKPSEWRRKRWREKGKRELCREKSAAVDNGREVVIMEEVRNCVREHAYLKTDSPSDGMAMSLETTYPDHTGPQSHDSADFITSAASHLFLTPLITTDDHNKSETLSK